MAIKNRHTKNTPNANKTGLAVCLFNIIMVVVHVFLQALYLI